MNHSRSLAAVIFAIGLLGLASTTCAQEPVLEGKPALEVKPVVQKPDAKTLIEKASYLIGYNFMNSAKSRPEAKLEQIFAGMMASANNENQSSFIAGYQMMERIKSNGAKLDLPKCKIGMENAVANKDLGMSDAEVEMVMKAFSQMVEEKRVAELKKKSDENLAAGEAYLKAEMAKSPNLKELESGIYFEVLKQGSGKKPEVTDRVRIDYTGRFINGKIFDSSIEPLNGSEPAPAEFGVNEVVPGFSKSLQGMQAGSTWRVIIPGSMAYGVRGSGSIGPNETLVFEIRMLEILDKK